MKKILLTGGSGFIGQKLLAHPMFSDATVIGRNNVKNCKNYIKHDLVKNTKFNNFLEGIDIIIHLAAKAHIMKESKNDTYDSYHSINTVPTIELARQAIEAGVKRFIFISTIKVLGENTDITKPFHYKSPPGPVGSYSVSKWKAELGLQEIAKNSNMEIVIIRPPLVYGDKVKGNFAKLLKLVSMELLLPLGSIKNKRSYVAVDNLIDFIVECSKNPKAANKTFLVSDNDDLSTPRLFHLLSKSGGYKNRLIKLNIFILKFIFAITGKNKIYQRLADSMHVDITYTMEKLDWSPPITVDDALNRCWEGYKSEKN